MIKISFLAFQNTFGDFLDEAKSFSQSQKIFFPKYTPGIFFSMSGSCRLLSRAKQIDSPNIIKNRGKSFNERKV